MNKIITTFLSLLVFSLLVTSCKKDDPKVEHEHEVITTMKMTLTPAGGGSATVLSFKDLDGDGGVAPVITGGTLKENTTYTGAIELLNETESPADDITKEVKEEDKEHQFFFKSTIAGLTVAYKDQDGDGNPLGLSTELKTGAKGTGTLTVTLRHEPNKTATGVKGGDITNAGGETDIEVTFPVTVE